MGFSRQEYWSRLPFPSPIPGQDVFKNPHRCTLSSNCSSQWKKQYLNINWRKNICIAKREKCKNDRSFLVRNDEVCVCYLLSCVRLYATLWTVACLAPLSTWFPRREYWSRYPYPSLGDLPNPGVEPWCPALQVDSLQSEPPGKPLKWWRGETMKQHLWSFRCKMLSTKILCKQTHTKWESQRKKKRKRQKEHL